MITPEQRITRRAYIGSSDVAALCNVDPYRSLHDLWADKTGKLEDREAGEDAERGIALEPYVLSMFDHRMGVQTVRDIELRNGGVFAANLDGACLTPDQPIYIDSWPCDRDKPVYEMRAFQGGRIYLLYSDAPIRWNAVVEAKTTVDIDSWGKLPDGVPLRVFVQVQEQMYMAECDIAYVPVLFPKYKNFCLEVYQVVRDQPLIDQIIERGETFMEKYVKRDIPPPSSLPYLETLKRWKREPNSLVQLGVAPGLEWSRLEKLKEQKRLLEKQIEEGQAAILSSLGDAEAGELPDGARLTYLQQNSTPGIDLALLRMRLREKDMEAVFSECVRQGRHRVLRYKKAPERKCER